ncbi:MAG: hypothetical protein RBR52_11705 [Thiomonas sp.]|uniref:hypothetical protein n=1 Tax=Thiomonas sp. TaxID=2047785 RepID=UPI002A3649C8|nr:hypothetical protein [Thiomonas sp.]MDY0331143.1 hypothetical protein [Thiomonas sp.]
MQTTRRTPKATACHEAAHAVAALHFGARLDKIQIDTRGGQCDFSAPSWWTDRTDAVALLVGPLASVRVLKKNRLARILLSQDYEIACELCRDDQELWAAMDDARALLREFWPQIQQIASALLEAPGQELSGDEVMSIFSRCR